MAEKDLDEIAVTGNEVTFDCKRYSYTTLKVYF